MGHVVSGVVDTGELVDGNLHRVGLAGREADDPHRRGNRALRDRGVINTENLANLERVVGKRFLYIGLPLRLVGGTGCPIRAVALLDA